jgi:hypothetical protein
MRTLIRLFRKKSTLPKTSDITQWFHQYPGDPTIVQEVILRHAEQLGHPVELEKRLQEFKTFYSYLLTQPAYITHYSNFRTATLQKIPDIIESLSGIFRDVPENTKDGLRDVLTKYLSLVYHIQSSIITDELSENTI